MKIFLDTANLDEVLDMLFNHPLTDKGLEQFLKDWDKVFHEEPVGR